MASLESKCKFAVDLWDGFDTVARHTNNEIQFVKDVLKFFKKRKEIEEEYAKNLAKLTQKSQYTIPLGTVCRGWEDLLSQTQNTANVHTNVVNQINEKVTEALQVLIKDLENTRKNLYTDGTNLNNEYQKQVEELKKTKLNYEKASKEAEIAQKTLEAAKYDGITKAKDLPKFEREAAKKQQAAQTIDDTYKKKVEDTNNFLESYYTEKMPRILNEFEHLETVRVHMLKSNFKKYLTILESVPPSLSKELRTLQESVELISPDADVDQFVKQNKTGADIPEPFEYEPYVQGNVQAKSTAPLTHRFMKYIPKTNSAENLPTYTPASAPRREPPPTACFGVPLERIMERQKAQYPDLDVPRVVVVLSEAVLKMGGVKSEGIFRIPATANEVKAVKDKLDDGNFNVIEMSQHVHTPCALLKLWLREISDPIIPVSSYETCVEHPERSMEVFDSLPPINKKTVTFIINFIQCLAHPDYVEITKMSKENLCMVFAPGFLRCPYTEPNKILSAAEKEKIFLVSLFDKLPPSNKPWAHLLSSSSSSSTTGSRLSGSGSPRTQSQEIDSSDPLSDMNDSESPPPGYDILGSSAETEFTKSQPQSSTSQTPSSPKDPPKFNIGGSRSTRKSQMLGPLQYNDSD